MQTIFIAGSIAIKNLNPVFIERIDKIVTSDELSIIVGDANGSDTSIQAALLDLGARNVIIYCSGDEPRNNVGDWPVSRIATTEKPGSRAFFTAKDREMAFAADYGLMVWDSKSTGTLSNVIELLKQDKRSVVFINKLKKFTTVGSVEDLVDLIGVMSSSALSKAETKIHLSEKISEIKTPQMQMAF